MEQPGHRPQYVTSASPIEKPWSSAAVRQGASPTAQSTSATTPHDRHTMWWWLSPTRPSNRAGLPPLDAAQESRRGERVKGLIHGLQGDMAYAIAHRRGDRLDPEVVTVADGLEQCDAGGRHPQAGTSQLLSGGLSLGCGHSANLPA